MYCYHKTKRLFIQLVLNTVPLLKAIEHLYVSIIVYNINLKHFYSFIQLNKIHIIARIQNENKEVRIYWKNKKSFAHGTIWTCTFPTSKLDIKFLNFSLASFSFLSPVFSQYSISVFSIMKETNNI